LLCVIVCFRDVTGQFGVDGLRLLTAPD
jgi:hypothetical protein